MSREERDFLSRWSSRKLKGRDEPEPEPAPPATAEPAAAEPAEPERPDEEILRELGLPDPDTLVKGDDFAAFLKSGVPTRLRNRALRRLWVSDPVLANLDGLNDYDQDFTDAATVVKDLKTSYNVLRGFLRDEPPPEAVASAEPDGPAGDAAAQDGAAPPEEVAAGGEPAPADPADGGAAPGGDAEMPQTDHPTDGGGRPDAAVRAGSGDRVAGVDDEPLRPRRMHFRFEG